MSTRFPLGVRLRDRYITKEISGLRWKVTAPGGYHSASLALNLEPGSLLGLNASDPIRIFGPSGRTLFQGFIDNPGRFSDRGGSGFELSAMGTTVLASDQARPLVYVDRELVAWEAYQKNLAYSSASVSPDPANVNIVAGDGLLTQFNRQAVPLNGISQIGYTGMAGTDMQVGGIYAVLKSGKNDSGHRNQYAYAGPASAAARATSTPRSRPRQPLVPQRSVTASRPGPLP